jgi:uncharacterized protein YeaO (DUF488 family)
VRRLPRGVPKSRYAIDNWFDVWLPNLAPSAALVAMARSGATDAAWSRFVKRYTRELSRPETVRVMEALAALSHHANFSVGCYCENDARCHRRLLAQELQKRGAILASP